MKYLLFVFAILISAPTFSDEFRTELELRKFSEQVLNLFAHEKFQEGFNLAKPYWPMPSVEIDGIVNQIQQQWPIVQNRFGKPTGFEFVRSESIGKSFIRYYYLHKFENHAIYWRIDFYRPIDGWKINSMLFLDNLDKLYETDA